jgi:hypothetical protein
MQEIINSSIDIAGKSVDFIDNVIEKIEKYRKIKQDTTSYLRLLYIEVIGNIEILKTVNFEKFDKVALNDAKIKTLFHLLRTDIAESIFYKNDDNPNNELYERLKKRGKVLNKSRELVQNAANGDDKKVSGSFIYENILQAISFVVTKIDLLRKYSQLTEDDLNIFRPLKIKTRLININQRLVMIKNVMDTMDEIKEMAR